jgi:hypothetical protein
MGKQKTDDASKNIGNSSNDPSNTQFVGVWAPAMSVEYAFGSLALPEYQQPTRTSQKQVQPRKKQDSWKSWQLEEQERLEREEDDLQEMITEQLEAFRKNPSQFPAWAAVAKKFGMEEAENQMCEWLGDSYC